MLKEPSVYKTEEGKIIAHWNPRRRFASYALSLVLLFTGSSGAIFAQAERGNKRREAHKRRPEKRRGARKRGRWKGLSSARARARSERKPQTHNRAFETERDGRKRYEETKREAIKRRRG